jgi:hypothetical protein
MYIHIFILSTLLFFALSPNILLRLPPKGSKYIVALVHAVIFGGALAAILKYYRQYFLQEGLENNTTPPNKNEKECRSDYSKCLEKCSTTTQRDRCYTKYKQCVEIGMTTPPPPI